MTAKYIQYSGLLETVNRRIASSHGPRCPLGPKGMGVAGLDEGREDKENRGVHRKWGKGQEKK